MHKKRHNGLVPWWQNLFEEEKAACTCAGFPPQTMGQHNRPLHQGPDLTYDEALRVRKLFEEFPEIFIPLFVCWTQHLQITECLLRRGAGMSTEKWSGKTGTPW